jgi:hypothetical protein
VAESHIQIVEQPQGSKRTKTWRVVGKARPDVTLGEVAWLAPWRRYVFHSCDALFDAGCLRELADFCSAETLKRQAARREERARG